MLRERLLAGLVIPAHPLALKANRKLDERRQRALTRYYVAAGAGGVAVGVHTTQFAIRNPGVDLFKPVLELACEELRNTGLVKIAGVCGGTNQAVGEAETARALNYDAALLSLGALAGASVQELLDHARRIAAIMPVMGFYLQPSVGGRVLPYEFWRRFVEIDNVVAIKIAPFNRYHTLDVVRAVVESGRGGDIALYTGNDDNIVADLLTEFRFDGQSARMAGGLLGHWAVWTKGVVDLCERMRSMRRSGDVIPAEWLTFGQQITDMNAAIFDAAHQFRGCIAGINEVLRRQGLLQGRWLLDPDEDLSDGQASEIDRVCAAYPQWTDDEFVRAHLDEWLS